MRVRERERKREKKREIDTNASYPVIAILCVAGWVDGWVDGWVCGCSLWVGDDEYTPYGFVTMSRLPSFSGLSCGRVLHK